MAVHTHGQDVQITVVIVEGRHGQIEAAVLGYEVPGLRVAVRLREGLDIHGTEFVDFSVNKEGGLGGVGLIPDAPGDLEAEKMFFFLCVPGISGAVAPAPGDFLRL